MLTSAERQRNYEWAAEYMRRAEAVLVAQAELRAAEQHLLAIRRVSGGGKILNARKLLRGDPLSIDEDTAVAVGVPDIPRHPKAGEMVRFTERFTRERAQQVRELAERRAAEEAAGHGTDFSGVPRAGRRPEP